MRSKVANRFTIGETEPAILTDLTQGRPEMAQHTRNRARLNAAIPEHRNRALRHPAFPYGCLLFSISGLYLRKHLIILRNYRIGCGAARARLDCAPDSHRM